MDAIEHARQFALRHPNWSEQPSDEFPHAAFAYLQRTGLLSAPLERQRGGLGLDLGAGRTLTLLTILKHIGYGDLSAGRLYEGHINALQLISLFGTPEQMDSAVRDVMAYGRIFAVWNTDDEDGVRIVSNDGQTILEGAKSFASGADNVQRPLITGELPDGRRQLVLVPMEWADIRVEPGWWDPIGMEGSQSVRVDFSGTRIDPSALVGGPDDYIRQPWFFAGAIRFSAVQLGAAEALFDETRAHLRKLDRTEDPYQRQRAGQMAMKIESGNQWLIAAASQFDAIGADGLAEHSDRIVNYVYMARSGIEQICQEVMDLCIRSVGAQGLARSGRFQRIVRDLMLYLRQPAPDAAIAGAGAHSLESQASVIDLWRVPGDIDKGSVS
ncbi:MAG: acyl-CoA dehydrogenase [Thermomicrobiales bacterium]